MRSKIGSIFKSMLLPSIRVGFRVRNMNQNFFLKKSHFWRLAPLKNPENSKIQNLGPKTPIKNVAPVYVLFEYVCEYVGGTVA